MPTLLSEKSARTESTFGSWEALKVGRLQVQRGKVEQTGFHLMMGWNPISVIPDFRKWGEGVGFGGWGPWENPLGTLGTLVLISLICGATDGASCHSQSHKGAEGTLGKVQMGQEGPCGEPASALSPSPQWTQLPGPAWPPVCWVACHTAASMAQGSGRQQHLDELLELLPVLVDVDLRLPEGIDQHRITDLVQHDVCS